MSREAGDGHWPALLGIMWKLERIPRLGPDPSLGAWGIVSSASGRAGSGALPALGGGSRESRANGWHRPQISQSHGGRARGLSG